ncbi:MAG: tryptophan-rich sensory protein, partial [Chloroflexota bacterium]
MDRKRILRWLVVFGVVATLITNMLANALPINGLNTGEISDRFEVFFVPAGYVFSIWGLIYIGLAAFAVYQVLPSTSENKRLDRISLLFLISSAANIAWIFFWHYLLFGWSLLAMLVLLLSLIMIYL